jgi:ABC-type transport system substrate-binding protein
MERAAFQTAWLSKKLHGVCFCVHAHYGNAASRMAEFVPSDGAFPRGADPDIEALYRQQSRETDKKKREALLHQIQQLLYERVRFGPIWEYIWPSGIGPRVGDPRRLPCHRFLLVAIAQLVNDTAPTYLRRANRRC